MEQPSWDADVAAWRKYAGELRQKLGEAKKASSDAFERGERWKQNFQHLLYAKNRDGHQLDKLERLLDEGDVPAAVDLLAERRRYIQAAKERS